METQVTSNQTNHSYRILADLMLFAEHNALQTNSYTVTTMIKQKA